MAPEPIVKPLSHRHRTWFFRLLLVVFVCSVPVFMFYATGYRFSLFDQPGTISTVGGLFISAETDNTQIFVNDELIDNYRLFQRAAYIQNVPAGVHRIHVQGEGLHTWVKELPVYAHIVTEAAAFNFPLVPQLRVVSEYQDVTGVPVVRAASTTLPASSSVIYRNDWIASSTYATSTLTLSAEYLYLMGRFGTSTDASVAIIDRINDELENFRFSSNVATTSATSTATTTKSTRDRILSEDETGQLSVRWQGSASNIPYYYCVQYLGASTTAALYGAHVAQAITSVFDDGGREPLVPNSLTCRDSISIDTDPYEIIYSFDFLPNNNDLIVMHTSEGLYVVETDDRGWQNAQQMYPAGEYDFLIDGTQLFIRENGVIFELLPTLAR